MEAADSNDYNSPDWQQAGHNADALDLAGPGARGRLECSVGKPQKEGEGTQNPYISYLVSTEVSIEQYLGPTESLADEALDRLQILPEHTVQCAPTLHGLRLPIQDTLQRLPTMRRSAYSR